MRGEITISFEGRSLCARAGESVAAALLRHGIRRFRMSPTGPRGPVCGMGVCFECSVEVTRAGESPIVLRACVTPVEDGMKIAAAPNTLPEGLV
ncbi:(2Fe-2S)-binding protein [Thalassovita mangrovi]|uniref:(2Fe-2S)-binding protein n=1 Tax=Thalassovita mangrovi TaxID=2692236 RepID=A0A6L8LNI4_9RHOB|nr:(2Fe-2S)-binding protein [Thalassovita mangrovi]MYM57584.1 (2Fe-2S)-binding protein [Thalassovita mangrovi]